MNDGVDRERWNTAHRAPPGGLLGRLRRDHLTAALPPDIAPTTIWPALPLEVLAEGLALRAGETLVDMACGNGAIGIRVAELTGARLIGVDPSATGLALARERAASSDVGNATYVEGHFRATGLADAVADAVLVVDALQFAEDRLAALRELARVLRPGRRLVVAGPEPLASGGDDAFAGAELRVVQRAETPAWQPRVLAFHDALHANADALRAELGKEGAERLLSLPIADAVSRSWHGLVVAERLAA